MTTPRYPALFQINTRVRLAELSAALGRKATLDDLLDAEPHNYCRIEVADGSRTLAYGRDPYFATLRFATAPGSSSCAGLHGMRTGPGTISSLSPGPALETCADLSP